MENQESGKDSDILTKVRKFRELLIGILMGVSNYDQRELFDELIELNGIIYKTLNKIGGFNRRGGVRRSVWLSEEVIETLEPHLFRLLELMRTDRWDEVFYLILRAHAANQRPIPEGVVEILSKAQTDIDSKIEAFRLLSEIISRAKKD